MFDALCSLWNKLSAAPADEDDDQPPYMPWCMVVVEEVGATPIFMHFEEYGDAMDEKARLEALGLFSGEIVFQPDMKKCTVDAELA